MQKKIGIGLAVGLFLTVLLSGWGARSFFLAILQQPFRALLSSSEPLQTGMIEVSENLDPWGNATRRLFKPFGRVRVTRRFPGPPMPPHQSPEAPSSNQKQER